MLSSVAVTLTNAVGPLVFLFLFAETEISHNFFRVSLTVSMVRLGVSEDLRRAQPFRAHDLGLTRLDHTKVDDDKDAPGGWRASISQPTKRDQT